MSEFPGLLISNPTITAAPVCVDPLQGVGGFVHICSRGGRIPYKLQGALYLHSREYRYSAAENIGIYW
jgi:hypothetical protein